MERYWRMNICSVFLTVQQTMRTKKPFIRNTCEPFSTHNKQKTMKNINFVKPTKKENERKLLTLIFGLNLSQNMHYLLLLLVFFRKILSDGAPFFRFGIRRYSRKAILQRNEISLIKSQFTINFDLNVRQRLILLI